MQAARHCVLIADFVATTERGIAERAAPIIRADDADDDYAGDDEVAPWDAPLYSVSNGIATVEVSGPIVKGYDAMICWFFGLLSLDRLQLAVAELGARADVAAVVFRINSPGGMATGTPETAQMIVALGEIKPTIGFTSDKACSAAYWLFAACGVCLAAPSATIGSIGTYLALYDYSEYLAELGIKLELFRAGALKGIGLMGKALTEDEKKFLQTSVDRINANFTGFVTARRPAISADTMQGQWFDGDEALERGLVDATVASESEIFRHILGYIPPAGALTTR
jgi:signal peptide peptidase SppA